MINDDIKECLTVITACMVLADELRTNVDGTTCVEAEQIVEQLVRVHQGAFKRLARNCFEVDQLRFQLAMRYPVNLALSHDAHLILAFQHADAMIAYHRANPSSALADPPTVASVLVKPSET